MSNIADLPDTYVPKTLISANEALQKVLEAAGRTNIEAVSLAAARGRILCKPISANRDFPPCDRLFASTILCKQPKQILFGKPRSRQRFRRLD
ncbi:hypothetical protein [Rhodoflexus sp.]